MNVNIDQLLHGYRRGHEQLAGSAKLPAKDADLIARLSDLSGTPRGKDAFLPYLTVYPLPSNSHFAVAKTWPDLHASRAGCVLTHTLLVPMESWRTMDDPLVLASLHREPHGSDDTALYCEAINLSASEQRSHQRSPSIFSEQSDHFVLLYFARGKRPIVWFDHPMPEMATWKILGALWPALRGRFAVCTHCLQPRTLDDRPFDLMFADTDVMSRFLKIDREHFVSQELSESVMGADEWCSKWSARIFNPTPATDFLEPELFAGLDDDPTAIRRLYLIDTAFRSTNAPPQAAVGAMDLVESVAPSPQTGVATKTQVANRAVRIARETKSDSDSIECLRLIEDRLKRPAFAAVAETVGRQIAAAVAARTESGPEVVARLPEGSYDLGSIDGPSWFVRGIVDGFRRLLEKNDSRLIAIRSLPYVSSLLFASDVSAEGKFVHALTVRRGESDVRTSVRAILRDDSKQSRMLRHSILSDFGRNDVELLEDLLTHVEADEISHTLDSVVPFFGCDGVRSLVEHRLVKTFPSQVRRWSLVDAAWSAANAGIAAATYQNGREGLLSLLGERLPDEQKASILVEYMKRLSQGRFPAWLRQAVAEDERTIDLLLSAADPQSQEVDALVSQIMRECEELRMAHFPRRLAGLTLHKGRPFYSVLAHLTFSDLLKGYIDGTIPESACLPYLEGDSISEWLDTVEYSSLVALLTHQAWSLKENWLNSWKLMVHLPSPVYRRVPSILLSSIDALLRVYRPAWSEPVARTWVSILQRARIDCSPSKLALQVQGFRYAIYNSRYPLSGVVVETFQDIYSSVTSSGPLPHETAQLFGMWDWDKGKELRKTLIDTFMGSEWPPGDLALATADSQLFRKIFKRIHRKYNGDRFLNAMLADLDNRRSDESRGIAASLRHLMDDPDFYEDWD